MAQQLAVTLIATSNPHITNLPQRGLLELCELGVDGRVVAAVWRATNEAGDPVGGPAQVSDPVFVYTHPGAQGARDAAATAALTDLLDSFDDIEDLNARALDIVRVVLGAVDGRTSQIAAAHGGPSAPSTPHERTARAPMDAVSAAAGRIAREYRGSDLPTASTEWTVWVRTTQCLLASANIGPLDTSVTGEQVVAFAEQIYDKMTESTGLFLTSTQRQRWTQFAAKVLAESGWEIV